MLFAMGLVRALPRLLAVSSVALGALLLGGGPAHADPPPGWAPGEFGLEYDYADIGWTHRGWYDGTAGNVHTGWVNVEEDDDVLTVELNDWFCPAGATPPSPADSRDVPTACKWRSGKFVNYIQWWDVATFDHRRDKLIVRGDFTDAFSAETVRLDLVLKSSDPPEVVSDETGPVLDYSETFDEVVAVGKVDGRRVDPAANRTQTGGLIRFTLDGWERIP